MGGGWASRARSSATYIRRLVSPMEAVNACLLVCFSPVYNRATIVASDRLRFFCGASDWVVSQKRMDLLAHLAQIADSHFILIYQEIFRGRRTRDLA